MTRIPHTCDYSYHRQQGLTLVEMMVAITISLILMTGVIQIFLSSNQSHNVQNGMAQLQENARFALDALSKDIGNAGYSVILGAPDRVTLANTLDNVTPNTALNFTVAVGNASDQIEVNYESTTDCLGAATATGIATNRYTITGTDLTCNGGIIAQNVENMQILYGIDTNGDGVANQYVKASSITDIKKIVSVRVAVLVSTVNSVGQNSTGTFSLLNAPAVGPFSDNLLRRVFTRTILVRTTPP